MAWFHFFLLGLAAFRFTHLLVYDRITAFIRKPFLEVKEETDPDGSTVEVILVKGTGLRRFFGELLSCHWCTGVWCAAILYVGSMYLSAVFEPVIYILAISGLAAVIEEWLRR